MMQLDSVSQMGFDEQVIEDKDIEHALAARQAAKLELSEVRSEYDDKHKKAMAAIERLELPEGGVARVGDFRISRKAVPARHVEFDSKATSRVSITNVTDE